MTIIHHLAPSKGDGRPDRNCSTNVFQLHRHAGSKPARMSRALFALAALWLPLSGCGTIPDASAYLHDSSLHEGHSKFVGPDGPLTTAQGHEIVARLEQ